MPLHLTKVAELRNRGQLQQAQDVGFVPQVATVAVRIPALWIDVLEGPEIFELLPCQMNGPVDDIGWRRAKNFHEEIFAYRKGLYKAHEMHRCVITAISIPALLL